MFPKFLKKIATKFDYGPFASHVLNNLKIAWKRLTLFFFIFSISFSSIFFFENEIKKSVGSYLIPTATLRIDNPKAETFFRLLPFDWNKVKKNYFYERYFLNNVDLELITQNLKKIDNLILRASSNKTETKLVDTYSNLTQLFLETDHNQSILPMREWSPQESETWNYFYSKLPRKDFKGFILAYIEINEHIHKSLYQLSGTEHLVDILWIIEKRKKLLEPSLIQIQKENNWITNHLPRAYYSNELTNIEMYQKVFENSVNSKRVTLKKFLFVIMLSLQFTLFTFVFSLRRNFSDESTEKL